MYLETHLCAVGKDTTLQRTTPCRTHPSMVSLPRPRVHCNDVLCHMAHCSPPVFGLGPSQRRRSLGIVLACYPSWHVLDMVVGASCPALEADTLQELCRS